MKTIKLSIVAMLLLGAVSCKKSNNVLSVNANVSGTEAADMVAGSLSSNSNGVASISADVTNVGSSLSLNLNSKEPVSDDATIASSTIGDSKLECGLTKSDSISRQSNSGSSVAYSYNLAYNFTLNCNNNVPDNLVSILTYSGNYSGPNVATNDKGSADFTVAGLSPHATDFIINGEYKRSGTFQSKIDTSNHGSHSIDIVVNTLTLTKPVRTIVSGTATITVTGNVPKKGNFSYSGTLKFNGDGTATLTLNGTVYTVNITTGLRVKV